MAKVKASVIIPAYNATATLERAVWSVLNQTLFELEVIVIDDASTDGTLAMAKALAKADKRVRVVALPVNSKQSVARNKGFEAATGEWLAVLDADDAYTPERLEVMIAHAEANKLDMVGDNQLFYDAQADAVSRIAMPNVHEAQPWTTEIHLRNERTGAPFKWGLLKAVIKASFLKKSGVEYRPHCKMGEDSLFYSELLMHGAKAAVVPDAMYVYTTARGELSRKKSGFSTSKYKVEDRLETYTYFKKHYAKQLTPELLKLVNAGEAATIAFDQANKFKGDVRRLKVASALTRVVRYPGLVKFLVISIKNVLRARMMRLKRRSGGLAAQ